MVAQRPLRANGYSTHTPDKWLQHPPRISQCIVWSCLRTELRRTYTPTYANTPRRRAWFPIKVQLAPRVKAFRRACTLDLERVQSEGEQGQHTIVFLKKNLPAEEVRSSPRCQVCFLLPPSLWWSRLIMIMIVIDMIMIVMIMIIIEILIMTVLCSNRRNQSRAAVTRRKASSISCNTALSNSSRGG